MGGLCRTLLVVAAGLVAHSCNSTPPAAPTAVTSTRPPDTPAAPVLTLVPVRITAVVRDEQDQPVAGADVIVPNYLAQRVPQPITVSTSPTGAFEANVMLYSPSDGQVVQVRKAGFEPGPTRHYSPPDPDVIIRLYPVTRIVAGETAHLAVWQGGMLCGQEDEFLCRRVRVRAPVAGVLGVEVTGESGASQLGLVVGGVSYPYRRTARLTMPVTAGSETTVDVLKYPGGEHQPAPSHWHEPDTTFTLTTSLRP